MPDWIGHLAIGLGTGKALRVDNLRLVLLGAVLPDVNILVGLFCEANLAGLRPAAFLPVVLPIFSPFAVLCYCLAVACWLNKTWQAFGLLLVGAATHIACDMLQVGHIEMFFFPFSVKLFVGSLIHYGGKPYVWFAGFAVLFLVAFRFFPQRNDIYVTWRRGWMCLLPLVVLAMLIGGSVNRFKRENIYNYAVFCDGQIKAGSVAVHVSCEVIQSTPLLVKDCGQTIRVDWPLPIPEGKQVAIWGRYDASGRLKADRIVVESRTMKIAFSLIGALILLAYWVRIPLIDNKSSGGSMPAPG